MKKSLAALGTVALTALLAVSCMSSKPMMMSDHSMMSSDGTMMMSNSDGTSRAMTDQERQAHMTMMMNDPRYASMMMDRCKSMGSMSNGSASGISNSSGMSNSAGMSNSTGMSGGTSSSGMSNSSGMAGGSSMSGMSGMSTAGGTSMMVMNSDGTSRAMTDAEYRSQMDMMMKNSQMSAMMMSKCNGM
jgi:hypothetical protein